MVELEPLDLLGLGEHDRARRGRVAVLVAEVARVGDRGQVTDEVAGGGARLAPAPGRRQLAEPGEVDQPLGGLGAGGEQAVAAKADPLDQPADEDVGAQLLQRPGRRRVEAQEGVDPVAGLGRKLRALERRVERRDHVELAPSRDRRHPGEVHRAQLDRRPRQRADDGGRVVGIGEHAQPGERVADLRALEEGGVAGEAEGDVALLERGRHQAALAPARGDDHADRLGLDLARGQQVLDLARRGLGLGALAGAAPEADDVAGAPRRAPRAVAGIPPPPRRRREARAEAHRIGQLDLDRHRDGARRTRPPPPPRRRGTASPPWRVSQAPTRFPLGASARSRARCAAPRPRARRPSRSRSVG